MILRSQIEARIDLALSRSRAVVLSGPRQSGKSTLARKFLPLDSPRYFDLENPNHVEALREPMRVLEPLDGLVVIDEVQRAPGLFPLLRYLIDRDNRRGQYLLLGSASPAMLRQAGESLLGRVEVVEITGFDLQEIVARTQSQQNKLWLRGGFPDAYLASTDEDSLAWRLNAINAHVEVDLPQFGVGVAAPAMLRFWRMLAHCHAQIWNAAPIASSLGVSEPTIRRYLDTLTQTLMVRQLQPWFANITKRQVKSPKIYLRDSGLHHALLNIRSLESLLIHPISGHSWEGFALEQVIRIAQPDECYFWASHSGAELDLLLIKEGQRVGVEFKRSDAPKVTPSMRIALDTLQLQRLYVVYPGPYRYLLADGIEAVPLHSLF